MRRPVETADRKRTFLVSPKIIESIRRKLRIPTGMRDIPVTQIVLNRAGIVSVVRKFVAAGMSKHVRVRGEWKSSHAPRPGDQPANGRSREWPSPLSIEYVGTGWIFAF